MKKLFSSIRSAAVLGLFLAKATAADFLKPDSAGYIRDWVMLAPIALPEQEGGAVSVLKEQIKGEAALQPKDGDKIKINGKELAWRNISASTNYFDFNAVLRTNNDHAAGSGHRHIAA